MWGAEFKLRLNSCPCHKQGLFTVGTSSTPQPCLLEDSQLTGMTPLGFLNVRAMLNKIIIFSLFAGQNVNLSHHLYLFHWGLLYIPV